MIDITKRIIKIETNHAYKWRLNILLENNADSFNDELLNNEDKLLDAWQSEFPDMQIKKSAIELLNLLLNKTSNGPFNCLCGLIVNLYSDQLISSSERYLLSNIIYNDENHPKYDIKPLYFFRPGDMKSRIKYIEQLLVEYKQ